jgi:effector-binding domain-containing protein
MEQASPEFVIGQMRVLTMREMTFFYVTNQPTAFANLEGDLDPLLASLYAAKAQANIAQAGPDIVRYYRTVDSGEPDLWLMEVGIPVQPGTRPAGGALVKTLPPYHCAALLLWGSLAHIAQAYGTLRGAIEEAGLEHTGECREWNYWFESVDSPRNLLGLYMGVR